MKRFKWSLLIGLSILGLGLHAQTAHNADEVVTKYIDAIGGKDKITQIKSMVTESTMNIMGNDAPMTTTILNGKGFRNEVEFNGQKMVQVVNQNGGWMVNPMMGSTDPQAMPAEQYNASKSQIYIGGDLLNYSSNGSKLALQGTEKVGTVDAQKVVLTTPDNSTTTYYFDPATHYLLKMERTINMQGNEGTIAATYSDYRKTDAGLVIPYSIETTLPQGFSMTANVKKVEVNKEVDPKIFDMPK